MNEQYESYSFSFERMIAWKESRNLATEIYQLTSSFPINEMYSLTNQMKRSAVSISSNLSEGSGRTSPKDQAHFYQMAYSSLMGLLNQLYTSLDLNYICDEHFMKIRNHICSISFLINALRKSCLNKFT